MRNKIILQMNKGFFFRTWLKYKGSVRQRFPLRKSKAYTREIPVLNKQGISEMSLLSQLST